MFTEKLQWLIIEDVTSLFQDQDETKDYKMAQDQKF